SACWPGCPPAAPSCACRRGSGPPVTGSARNRLPRRRQWPELRRAGLPFLYSAIEQVVLLDVGFLQRLDQVSLFVEVARTLGELRLGDAGRPMAADEVAAAVLAQ